MCETCQSQTISAEEFIIMRKREAAISNKRYVAAIKRALKILEELTNKKNKDRMDYSYFIASMINLMRGSLNGWNKWCNIEKMHDNFETNEDMEKLSNEMYKIVFNWLNMDIKITNECIKKLEQETIKDAVKSSKKKTKKKRTKSKDKTTMYVA